MSVWQFCVLVMIGSTGIIAGLCSVRLGIKEMAIDQPPSLRFTALCALFYLCLIFFAALASVRL